MYEYIRNPLCSFWLSFSRCICLEPYFVSATYSLSELLLTSDLDIDVGKLSVFSVNKAR